MFNSRTITPYSLAALLFFAAPLHAEIYKWVDSNGSVHFSDKPRDGAEKVTLPPAQTYSPPARQEIKPEPKDGEPHEPTVVQEEERPYTKVLIVQPEDQSTIRSNQNLLSVQADVEPGLKKGDQIQLIYDGKPTGPPQKEMVFSLENVFRGAHTLQVQIVDEGGSVVKSSDTVTVYMHHSKVGGGN